MKHNDTHETLLARWVEGAITPEEARVLADMQGVEALETFLNDMDRVELPPMDLEVAWTQLAQKTTQSTKIIKTKKSNLFPSVMRIAAAVALIVGVGFWYTTNVLPQKFYAAAGETAEVVLPDGSLVTLNASTSLQYSKWNWTRKRQVDLAGEAFFKVAKGEQFVVKTVHGETTVLGTQFGIFDRNNTFQVKCFEGRVQVAGANQASILSKGNGIRIAKNTIQKLKVTNQKPAWMTGESKFFENSLLEVFDEMERQYILDIEFNQVDLNQQFTGVLPNTDLNKALAIVCSSMNLVYQIKNEKLIKISSK